MVWWSQRRTGILFHNHHHHHQNILYPTPSPGCAKQLHRQSPFRGHQQLLSRASPSRTCDTSAARPTRRGTPSSAPQSLELRFQQHAENTAATNIFFGASMATRRVRRVSSMASAGSVASGRFSNYTAAMDTDITGATFLGDDFGAKSGAGSLVGNARFAALCASTGVSASFVAGVERSTVHVPGYIPRGSKMAPSLCFFRTRRKAAGSTARFFPIFSFLVPLGPFNRSCHFFDHKPPPLFPHLP